MAKLFFLVEWKGFLLFFGVIPGMWEYIGFESPGRKVNKSDVLSVVLLLLI